MEGEGRNKTAKKKFQFSIRAFEPIKIQRHRRSSSFHANQSLPFVRSSSLSFSPYSKTFLLFKLSNFAFFSSSFYLRQSAKMQEARERENVREKCE